MYEYQGKAINKRISDTVREIENEKIIKYTDHTGQVKTHIEQRLKNTINYADKTTTGSYFYVNPLYKSDVKYVIRSEANKAVRMTFDFALDQGKKLMANVRVQPQLGCLSLDFDETPHDKTSKIYTVSLCYGDHRKQKDVLSLTVTSKKGEQELQELHLTSHRVPSTPNDYLVELTWKPELIFNSLNTYSNAVNKYKTRSKVYRSEYLKNIQFYRKVLVDEDSSFGSKVIKPLMNRMSEQLSEMKQEMSKTFGGRYKRAVTVTLHEHSDTQKKLKQIEQFLNVKFLVYNPDGHEIKLIIRDWTVKQNIMRLFNLKYLR